MARKNIVKHGATPKADNAQQSDYYNVPSSPITESTLRALNIGTEIATRNSTAEAINTRRGKYNRRGEIAIKKPGIVSKERTITQHGGNSKIEITIPDIEALTGRRKALNKMFLFLLIKVNQQAYSNGTLTQNEIGFSLAELVEAGLYKNDDSARAGLKKAADFFQTMKIKGEIKRGTLNKITEYASEVLFPGYRIKKGYCTIFISERVEWGLVTQFFTILPRRAFLLGNRPFDLLWYIFYIARQNAAELKKAGKFNIGLRAVQDRLGLPDEHATKSPQRDIKEEIERAITEIEDTLRERDFTITLKPENIEARSIGEYLQHGYLEIALNGQGAQILIDAAKRNPASKEGKRKTKAAQ